MTRKPPDRLVPRREAQDYAGVSHMTLYRWAKAGRITEYRNELGRIYIDLDEVDAVTRPVAS